MRKPNVEDMVTPAGHKGRPHNQVTDVTGGKSGIDTSGKAESVHVKSRDKPDNRAIFVPGKETMAWAKKCVICETNKEWTSDGILELLIARGFGGTVVGRLT